MCLWQDDYPINYYQWRLNIIRQRFATPDLRTMVAIDASTSKILGQASYAVEGLETDLYKRWVSEASSWSQWLEMKLILAEKWWARRVTDRSIDYKFLKQFMSVFDASDRPDCLHCHLIVVDPEIHAKGVGRLLIDWGKEVARKENLPLYLESNLEATGFYEKCGFSHLTKDFVVDPEGEAFHIPVYVWEGEDMQGRWLERDDGFDGVRWRWKEGVVPQ